jgi:hypothetical protein
MFIILHYNIIIQSKIIAKLDKDTGNNYKRIEQTYMTVELTGL